ncbi:MAG: hypothetical protein LBV41_09570 [Cytophagaceae bacterium]|jgi:hypothetical protein|nr:hypothetical protein [Cytophagaceae bacterium]
MINSLSSIRYIARFEAKTLLRSRLFRIFSALAIVVITLSNLAAFTSIGAGMTAYVVAGSVPYMNMLFLNIVQSVITIFLSSDFLGRDKKLDTTEAFYVRSVSNFGYVMGKTLGILTVFFFLNLVILLTGLIINIVSPTTDLVPVTYLIYPLLLSLPSVVLVLGLSFFLMTLIKNQAVTFILMLGLLGAGMFYFSNKWYNVLDVSGFNTAMAYSIFTGLSGVANLLMVRGAYVLLGFGFIFFTVLMLSRLPQERHFRTRTIAAMLLAFIPAIAMLSVFVIRKANGETLRAEIIKLEETLPMQPSLTITENHLSLSQNGNEIAVVSQLTAFTESSKISFVINQGFTIHNIKLNGNDVSFERRLHIVSLKSDDAAGKFLQIEITYSGKPDERTFFPEIPEDVRLRSSHLNMLMAGKEISYISPDYILLTREAGWYPVAAARNYRSYPQFTRFTLEAEVSPHLTVFSQGQKEAANNKVRFTPETPLNALSFTAGKYETRTLVLDSIEVTLAVHPRNIKFIDRYFTEINDTIPVLLSDMKGDFERRLGYTYPFKRFSVIEAPIHFYTFPRNWTLTTDDTMPEQLLLPERGAAEWNYDLKMQDRMTGWQNRDEGELLPKEKQARVFKNVVGNMLFSASQFNFGWNERLRHSIFPQYAGYLSGIEQEGFPAMQFIIENYLFSRVINQGASIFNFSGNSEQIVLKLKNKNLLSLLDSMKYDSKLPDLVSRKGAELFRTLQLNVEPQNIDDVLNTMLAKQNFELAPVDTFMHRLNQTTGNALSPLVDNWLHNTASAAFLFGETRASRINDGNRERFQVRLQAQNTGNGDGILSVAVREQPRDGDHIPTASRRNGSFNQKEEIITMTVDKTYMIRAGETVEIGIVSNSEPRELVINTFVAHNVPVSQTIPINNIGEERSAAFEGIRPYSGTILTSQPYEYIVDNEDAGFSIINQQEKNTLKDWWLLHTAPDTGDKYKSINDWRPAHKWEFVLGNYYGNYVRSMVYIRKGNGANKVQWKTELPESGNYTVYVYLPNKHRRWNNQDDNDHAGSYSYTVVHDDGEEAVQVKVVREAGWHALGSFYISKGTASIMLSDKTDEHIVIADAVKWVRR